MTNWWEELELENKTENPAQVKIDQMQAEIERLQAVNARLLAACDKVQILLSRIWGIRNTKTDKVIEEAKETLRLAAANSQPDPTGPRLPGLE